MLTLVGRGGATASELAEMRERGRIYWAAPRSQWFAEPKRLAEAGLLEATGEPGVTGPRTRYAVTAAGREAVSRWLRTPAGLPRMQHEPLLRVLAADLVDDPADALAGLAHLRGEIDAARAGVRGGELAAARLGDRGERLMANHRFAHRVLDALEDWLEEVRPLLGGGPDPGSDDARRPSGLTSRGFPAPP